jgi:hypothetical protein
MMHGKRVIGKALLIGSISLFVLALGAAEAGAGERTFQGSPSQVGPAVQQAPPRTPKAVPRVPINPDAINPAKVNPDNFNPDSWNPDNFNPDSWNPDNFNPDKFNPALSSAKPGALPSLREPSTTPEFLPKVEAGKEEKDTDAKPKIKTHLMEYDPMGQVEKEEILDHEQGTYPMPEGVKSGYQFPINPSSEFQGKWEWDMPEEPGKKSSPGDNMAEPVGAKTSDDATTERHVRDSSDDD